MSELLERILDPDNIERARKKVQENKGAPGVDGVTVEELPAYMMENWPRIRQQTRERAYYPQPVLRVEIPKDNGGVRKLGIPTSMDRVIQQAIAQVLSPIWEPLFNDNSYGFRPGRSAEQAIKKDLEYLNEGYTWIVDIDLEKFIDTVPQDRLMSLAHNVINDGDTESLIRRYLQSGAIVLQHFEPTEVGTPQGGNLSPLMSNIMLNELDKELARRGLHFTRYADDCIILVKSEASANRVMRSITSWIEGKLGLRVNTEKSHVTRPINLKYLGYGFYKNRKGWRPRAHQASVAKLKRKLKRLCKRNWGVSLTYRIQKINEVTRGWINYFAMADIKHAMAEIDGHLRNAIRMVIWKQWKKPGKREWGLRKLGVEKWQAHTLSYVKGYMVAAKLPQVKGKISKKILSRRGLVSLEDYYLARHALKSV